MDELMHYGVKGMKWGVRKQRQTSGKQKGKTNAQRIYERVTGKDKKQSTSSSKTESTPKKPRRVSEMSDDDLRRAINRMQMERTYAQLTKKQVSKGRQFVNDVLYNSAKNTATKVTTEAMQKMVRRLLGNSSGSSGSGGGGS